MPASNGSPRKQINYSTGSTGNCAPHFLSLIKPYMTASVSCHPVREGNDLMALPGTPLSFGASSDRVLSVSGRELARAL